MRKLSRKIIPLGVRARARACVRLPTSVLTTVRWTELTTGVQALSQVSSVCRPVSTKKSSYVCIIYSYIAYLYIAYVHIVQCTHRLVYTLSSAHIISCTHRTSKHVCSQQHASLALSQVPSPAG